MRTIGVVRRLRASTTADRLTLWRITHAGLRPGWVVLGLALVLGFSLVASVVQVRTGASSGPLIAVALAVAAAISVGAIVGSVHRAIVPWTVAVAVSYVAYRWRSSLGGGPLSGPFGYRNAFGALLLQGAFAWLLAGFAFRSMIPRAVSVVPAVVLGILAGLSSSAAAASAAPIVLAALAIAGGNGARLAVASTGAAVAFALAGTIWLGAAHDPDRPATGVVAQFADAGVTERRLALWHDALAIALAQPFGIGHARFATESPTALGDRDAIHAHNEFLEQAAEMGWMGFALSLATVTWAFARLAVVRQPDARTALAGAALGAIAIHACVDYVFHFPAIPIVAAALVGTGIVGRRRPGRP